MNKIVTASLAVAALALPAFAFAQSGATAPTASPDAAQAAPATSPDAGTAAAPSTTATPGDQSTNPATPTDGGQ